MSIVLGLTNHVKNLVNVHRVYMLKAVNTDESDQRQFINRDTYCVRVLE